MRNFDIYTIKFKYEDSDDYKIRPALILNNKIILLSKITSNNKVRDKYCYRILDYKEAGLEKPSTVRLNKTAKASKSDLLKYVGHLSKRDELNVIEILNEGENKMRFKKVSENKKRKKKDVTKGSFGFFQTLTGGDYEKAMNQFNDSVDFGGVTADGGAVSEDVENESIKEHREDDIIHAIWDSKRQVYIIPKEEWEDWD